MVSLHTLEGNVALTPNSPGVKGGHPRISSISGGALGNTPGFFEPSLKGVNWFSLGNTFHWFTKTEFCCFSFLSRSQIILNLATTVLRALFPPFYHWQVLCFLCVCFQPIFAMTDPFGFTCQPAQKLL